MCFNAFLGGDAHFDDDEIWTVDDTFDRDGN